MRTCYSNLVNNKEEWIPKRRDKAQIRQSPHVTLHIECWLSWAHQCKEQSLVVHRNIPMRWIIVFNNRNVNAPSITSVRTQPPTYMIIPCRDLEIKVQKQQQQNIEYPTWSRWYAAFIFQYWYLKSHQREVVTFHPCPWNPPSLSWVCLSLLLLPTSTQSICLQ